MDCTGCIVDESDALRYKVTHDLTNPDMCIVSDEVNGNLNIIGNGFKGAEKVLCEKDSVPQQKTSTRDKHFNLLPLY